MDSFCCTQVQSIQDEHVGSALKWREEHRRRTAVEEEALGVDNPEKVTFILRSRKLHPKERLRSRNSSLSSNKTDLEMKEIGRSGPITRP